MIAALQVIWLLGLFNVSRRKQTLAYSSVLQQKFYGNPGVPRRLRNFHINFQRSLLFFVYFFIKELFNFIKFKSIFISFFSFDSCSIFSCFSLFLFLSFFLILGCYLSIFFIFILFLPFWFVFFFFLKLQMDHIHIFVSFFSSWLCQSHLILRTLLNLYLSFFEK